MSCIVPYNETDKTDYVTLTDVMLENGISVELLISGGMRLKCYVHYLEKRRQIKITGTKEWENIMKCAKLIDKKLFQRCDLRTYSCILIERICV